MDMKSLAIMAIMVILLTPEVKEVRIEHHIGEALTITSEYAE